MDSTFKRLEYRDKSFWLEGGDYAENAPLEGDIDCDLAIVGGGFTGLSSAYYIKRHDPSLKIAVLEAQVIGFGASGRNGGFSMPLLGWDLTYLLWYMGRERGARAHHFAVDCVRNTQKMALDHNIDCDFEWVGLMEVARTPAQLRRLEREVEHYHSLGYDDVEYYDKAALSKHLNSAVHIGGRRDPVTAILNPAKMARGLKKVVADMGVEIYERTPITSYAPGPRVELTTPKGKIRARYMIVATNAFSMHLKVKHRYFVPMWTYIILTEPIPDNIYKEMNWLGREGIEDERIFVHYLRFTADNRLMYGGRDAPYFYGNKVTERENHPTIFKGLDHDMREMFPILKDIKITHRWGGPVAVTLDFVPTFGKNPDYPNVLHGLGYCGHGVALSLNAGRILRDLMFDLDTELTELPIVNNKLIPLPPEPFRFFFANGVRNLLRAIDSVIEIGT